jgi:hypothetical protein
MSFDSIPEDLKESYPCDSQGCVGDVTKDAETSNWECSICGFSFENHLAAYFTKLPMTPIKNLKSFGTVRPIVFDLDWY